MVLLQADIVGNANGIIRLKHFGTLNTILLSHAGSVMRVPLYEVALVPSLTCKLFSLGVTLEKSIQYRSIPTAIELDKIDVSFVRRSDRISVITTYPEMPEAKVNATLSPCSTSLKEVDMNYVHCSNGHVHGTLLYNTTNQLGLKLMGKLQTYIELFDG